jgi:proline dehydrogenase
MLFNYIAGNTLCKALNVAKMFRRNGEIPIFNYAVESTTKNTLQTYKEYEKLASNLHKTDKIALKLSSFNYDCKLIHDIIDIYAEKKIKVIIDAESNKFNDQYHSTVNDLIFTYNKQYPCITKTYQMYRVDSYKTLTDDIKLFSDVYLGTKIVRGAYWNSEVKDGHLFTQKSLTDINYNKSIILLHKYNQIYTVLATHNTLSIDLGKTYNNDNVFEFAHLMGMKNKHYNKIIKTNTVNVYVPYGPYLKMIPYLSRRLLENIDTIKYM